MILIPVAPFAVRKAVFARKPKRLPTPLLSKAKRALPRFIIWPCIIRYGHKPPISPNPKKPLTASPGISSLLSPIRPSAIWIFPRFNPSFLKKRPPITRPAICAPFFPIFSNWPLLISRSPSILPSISSSPLWKKKAPNPSRNPSFHPFGHPTNPAIRLLVIFCLWSIPA